MFQKIFAKRNLCQTEKCSRTVLKNIVSMIFWNNFLRCEKMLLNEFDKNILEFGIQKLVYKISTLFRQRKT